MIEGQDWFAFRNYPGHPPEHLLLVVRTPAGFWVTAILREPVELDPGFWRPVTGWVSTSFEKDKYHTERKRLEKHRG